MAFPYYTRTFSVVTSTTATVFASSTVIGSTTAAAATPSAVANIAPSGFIQDAMITCKTSNAAQIDILLFSSSMPNTTWTGGSAVAVSSQDVGNLVGVIHVSDWTNLGTPSLGQANGLGYAYQVPLQTLWCSLVSRGAVPTLGSTADISVTLNFLS